MARQPARTQERQEPPNGGGNGNGGGRKPALIARAKQHPEGDFMFTAGAAWRFKEGEGYVVKLHTIPTQWDGSFILVIPKDEE